MNLKTLVCAAVLFFLPWLTFFICALPEVAPRIEGVVQAGVVAAMIISPLLVAFFVHARLGSRQQSIAFPVLVGLLAALINSPVILLMLAVASQGEGLETGLSIGRAGGTPAPLITLPLLLHSAISPKWIDCGLLRPIWPSRRRRCVPAFESWR